jgi:hypothetical protein
MDPSFVVTSSHLSPAEFQQSIPNAEQQGYHPASKQKEPAKASQQPKRLTNAPSTGLDTSLPTINTARPTTSNLVTTTTTATPTLLQQPHDILLPPLIQRLQLHSQVRHPSLVLLQLACNAADCLVAAVHGLFELLEAGDVDC